MSIKTTIIIDEYQDLISSDNYKPEFDLSFAHSFR